MAKNLLKTACLATAAIGVLAFAGAATANDRCIDDKCTMLSLESLDGFFAPDATATGGSATTTVAQTYGTWGIDLSGMDTSVKPGDSFFDYVNGTAVKNMVIPADKTSIGSFVALRDLSEARSKAIIEHLAATPNLTGDEQKIAAAYNSMMDEATIEKLDDKPLQAVLAKIAKISTKSELAAYMGKTSGTIGASFFGIGVGSDAKNPQINVLQMGQSGLGLPDRDYYLKDSFAEKKAKYQAYVAQMLTMVGYADPDATAKDIAPWKPRSPRSAGAASSVATPPGPITR